MPLSFPFPFFYFWGELKVLEAGKRCPLLVSLDGERIEATGIMYAGRSRQATTSRLAVPFPLVQYESDSSFFFECFFGYAVHDSVA